MKAFRGVTPGFRACKAPVQQRPTAPNIFKMAEGGTGRRLGSAYIQLGCAQTAHARSMAASPMRMRPFLKDSNGRQESMGKHVFLVSILISMLLTSLWLHVQLVWHITGKHLTRDTGCNPHRLLDSLSV